MDRLHFALKKVRGNDNVQIYFIFSHLKSCTVLKSFYYDNLKGFVTKKKVYFTDANSILFPVGTELYFVPPPFMVVVAVLDFNNLNLDG